MSLLKLLQQAQGGDGLGQLAKQFGMDPAQAEGLAGMLAPAIGSAVKKKAQAGDLETVIGGMMGERQATYFEAPEKAAEPQAREEGAAFLERIMGSREAANGLAEEAANRSSVDTGTVQEFLPALAAMLQGGMQKQMPDNDLQGILGAVGSGGGGNMGGLLSMVGGMLGGGGAKNAGSAGLGPLMDMLDADGDGSVLDDVLERLMK